MVNYKQIRQLSGMTEVRFTPIIQEGRMDSVTYYEPFWDFVRYIFYKDK